MAPLSTLSRLVPIASVCAMLVTSPADAQPGPVQLFDGRLRIAGEVTVTAGARDDDAFFNYTDYERNALRGVHVAATALWQPRDRLAVVAEVRTDDFSRAAVSALYLRVRPWRSVPLDVQAGRIPPVFGAYGRQIYASDRLLIGSPLAHQYLTSLRADAIPADAGDLLRMRGRGWLSSFPVGNPAADAGVPLVSALQWDTGVQARWLTSRFEAAGALTVGTLARPRLTDDNDRPQLSGRTAVRLTPGLRIGLSGARGRFLADALPRSRPGGEQSALGADAEYAAGRFLVRAETVWSRWTLPYVTLPPEGDAISAHAAWVEARIRLTPRFYLAARADRLAFSHVTGRSPAERRDTWDAGVRRFEAGGGYSLLRTLLLRATVQVNERDGGRVTGRTYVASQVSWWF
jgi:hypothetical protein